MDDKVLRARQLYEALTQRACQRDDRHLARSAEYRELLALGIDLCQVLGADGFDRLTDQLYGAEDPRSAAAAEVLRHWWAGLARLYGQGDQGQTRGAKAVSANEDYVIFSMIDPATSRRRVPKSGAGLPPRQGHPVKLH